MTEELLTIPEASQRLGLKQKTIRRWVGLRKIEFIKVGERAVRIPVAEIERIVEAGRTPRLTSCAHEQVSANVVDGSPDVDTTSVGGGHS